MGTRDRYVPPDIKRLWEPERRYAEWFEVGLKFLSVRQTAGAVPPDVFEKLRSLEAKIDPERCAQLEHAHNHEVVAYLCHVEELARDHLGDGTLARYLHLGLTSSDLVDTANSLRMCKSIVVLLQRVQSCQAVFLECINRYRDTLHLARTHGQPAHPITFGYVLAGHLAELDRVAARLVNVLEDASGKLSGTVGVSLFGNEDLEKSALTELGLKRTPIATQIVPRDVYTDVAYVCVQTAAMAERFALNTRLLQSHGEVVEVQTAVNYSGSSAMPHKTNPISSERICGLARVVRSMLPPFLENQAMWHSRDLTQSSAERLMLPDLFGFTASILGTLEKVLSFLQVDEATMSKHAYTATFSESLLFWLQQERGHSYDSANSLVKAYIEEATDRGCYLYDVIVVHHSAEAAMWCTNMSRYEAASIRAVDRFLTDRRAIEVPVSYHHKALRSVGL